MSSMLDKILMAKREVDRFPPANARDFLGLGGLGMKVIAAPQPLPKVQVQDIKFRDGTSILPAAFRAEMNAWFASEFGFQPDYFADKAIFISGYGIVTSKLNAVLLTNIT